MPSSQTLLVDIGEGLSLMLGLPTIGSWNNKTRPQKPKEGTLGFNVKSNKLEYWDGSNWLEAVMEKA